MLLFDQIMEDSSEEEKEERDEVDTVGWCWKWCQIEDKAASKTEKISHNFNEIATIFILTEKMRLRNYKEI